MRRVLLSRLLLIACLLSNGYFVQGQAYWQQEVNYTIEVSLNDRTHTLSGNISIEYINNSPDVLEKIYFHLWPNAYRNRYTALAKQLYENGNDVLYTCPDSSRGYIDSLFFTTDGELLQWEYDEKHIDICQVYLKTPIRTGEKVVLNTPFKVKIPSGEISRLGHIEQSYQITQWYPKPAVYDERGWNQMPYLNQGEFFSEFGSYDVFITLPENYVVGATGDLQTKDEQDFLQNKIQETKDRMAEYVTLNRRDTIFFPASSPKQKTIRFTQSKVHDFAWFADKRYAVLKGEVTLPHSKRKVDTWAMFVPNNAKTWESSLEYLKDGTYYYSLWNGDYPYSHVSAVDGTISAGGGMEYPNITVIGNTSSKKELEVVIVHEVGHNWFYGILGSNEREYGWMDEGLNTLNEMRYIQTKYPEDKSLSDMLLGGRLHFDNLSHHDVGDISTQVISVLGLDQPVQTHSADFSGINYGVIMYQKTGLIFLYLKEYLGYEKFDKLMQTYFDKWKFRHPYPSDFRKIADSISEQSLSWLFDGLVNTTGLIDYKIRKVSKIPESDSTRIIINRKGQINGPVIMNIEERSGTKRKCMVEPGINEVSVPISKDSITSIMIDESKNIPDAFRSNNVWKNTFFPKLEPIKLEFLAGDNEFGKTNVFWSPVLNSNTYDKLNIGIGLHNISVPLHRFQYFIAPTISLQRIRPTGSANFSYRLFSDSFVDRVIFGLHSGMFGADETQRAETMHLSPYLKFNFKGNAISNFRNEFVLRGIWRKDVYAFKEFEQFGFFANHSLATRKTNYRFRVNSRYEYVYRNRLSDVIPIATPEVQLHRLQSTMKFEYDYIKYGKKKSFELGLHAGGNISGSSIKEFTYSYTGARGDQDFFMENPFFGRFEQNGFFANQRLDNMGGFNTGQDQLVNIDYLTAIHFSTQLPYVPNFLVLCTNYGMNSTSFAFNSGFGLRLGDFIAIDFPLFRTGNAFSQVDFKNYLKELRFVFTFKLSESLVNVESLIK